MSDSLNPMRPWGIAECAEYMGVSKSHFMQAVRYSTGFPAPLEPYAYTLAGKERHSQPEWAGIDIMIWRLGEQRVTRYLRQHTDKPNEINA